MTFAPWPPPPSHPWAESQSSANGQTPDFPGDAGDREKGKFRPSRTPRLTQLAVVDDDGNPIGSVLIPSFEELLDEIRLLRLALELQGTAAKVTLEDLD